MIFLAALTREFEKGVDEAVEFGGAEVDVAEGGRSVLRTAKADRSRPRPGRPALRSIGEVVAAEFEFLAEALEVDRGARRSCETI